MLIFVIKDTGKGMDEDNFNKTISENKRKEA